MKKATIIAVILTICIFGFVPLALAQNAREEESEQSSQEYDMVRGRVVSIDSKKNEIVIKEDLTQENRVIIAGEQIPSNIKIGTHVKIKLKKGTNEAFYVKRIRHAAE